MSVFCAMEPHISLEKWIFQELYGLVPASAAWKTNGVFLESVHKAVMQITLIPFKILKR